MNSNHLSNALAAINLFDGGGIIVVLAYIAFLIFWMVLGWKFVHAHQAIARAQFEAARAQKETATALRRIADAQSREED